MPLSNKHLPSGPMFCFSLCDERRTGFGTPYKFNAKELDCESGYYYYGARYYDPRMVRFLSVDPLAGEMPAWGSYTYTFDNSIRLVDPTGMRPEACPDCPKNDERYDYFRESKANYVYLGDDQVANKDNGEIEAIGPLTTLSAPKIGNLEQAWNSNIARLLIPDYISLDLGNLDFGAVLGMSISTKSFTFITRGDDAGIYYTPSLGVGPSSGINASYDVFLGGGYYTGHPNDFKYQYLQGGAYDFSGKGGFAGHFGGGVNISQPLPNRNYIIGGYLGGGVGAGVNGSVKYNHSLVFPIFK